MSLEYVNRLLAELPSGATVDIRFRSGGLARHHIESNRFQARDMPKADRRFTNLDSGREWFLPLSENVVIVDVLVHSLAIDIIP